MAYHVPCKGCREGDHSRHDGSGTAPPGMMGGEACMCNGNCNKTYKTISYKTISLELCLPCKMGQHQNHINVSRCPCEGACTEKVKASLGTTNEGLPSFDKLPEIKLFQMMAVGEVFIRWLAIKNQYEAKWKDLPPEQKLSQLPADIGHSALLRRMLVDRKLPLIIPPPTNYSYPVYPDMEDIPI